MNRERAQEGPVSCAYVPRVFMHITLVETICTNGAKMAQLPFEAILSRFRTRDPQVGAIIS